MITASAKHRQTGAMHGLKGSLMEMDGCTDNLWRVVEHSAVPVCIEGTDELIKLVLHKDPS